MRAAEIPAVGAPLRIVDRELPGPGPDDVLVRVDACGVCGSDVFLQDGGFGPEKLPRIPGHEAAGTIEAIGDAVRGLKAGDQVAIYYIEGPADSPPARRGRPNIGPRIKRMGVDIDGAFAEYVVRPAETLIVPPKPIDPVTLAVLTDAVATPYHALTRIAALQPGETLCVLGVGGIGSNAVQLGRWAGAHVVAVSRSDWKLDLARQLGADFAVTPDEVGDVLGADGADVVIQCADDVGLYERAQQLAGFGGRIAVVGSSSKAFRVQPMEVIWRELQILGSRGFTRDDIREVIDLHAGGAISTDHLTKHVRPLEEANEALSDLRFGQTMRTVLVP
jgi:propanol-preferring alcohol dehydrogenase